MAYHYNLSGKTFGRLTVIEPIGNSPKWGTIWLCKCTCGNTVQYGTGRLNSGHVQSCGCLRKDVARQKALEVRNYSSVAGRAFAVLERAAKQRNIENTISFNAFSKLIYQNCYYCGIEPNQVKNWYVENDIAIHGIDRVDNTKGYIEGNVVPCCRMCNIAKANHSQKEFLEWVNRVAVHQAKTGTAWGNTKELK